MQIVTGEKVGVTRGCLKPWLGGQDLVGKTSNKSVLKSQELDFLHLNEQIASLQDGLIPSFSATAREQKSDVGGRTIVGSKNGNRWE